MQDPLDWKVQGLSPWSRRVAMAAAEAILADEDAQGRLVPGGRAFCERGVDALDLSLGRASVDVRRGFAVLSAALEWMPAAIIGKPGRMSRLSLEDRVRYLERLEESKIGLFSMLFVAFKVPICIPAYDEAPELHETGFDRPNTVARRGRLPVTQPSGK